MSIILKGIDMPKEGEHILALIKNDGKCSYFEETTLSRIMKTTEAIQIPTPHGRLVDIDKVKDKLRDQIPYCGLDMTYSNSNAFDAMDNAPTILESEERDDSIHSRSDCRSFVNVHDIGDCECREGQMKTEDAISILEQLFDRADEMHESTNGDVVYWNQMEAINKAIESLKKENTSNKTIEELMKINSELAADNNNITKARRKIMELEMHINRLERERDKYQIKLIHRDEHFKEIIKESILELIQERWRP